MTISNLKFQILFLCIALSLQRISPAATLAPSGGDDTAPLQAALSAGGTLKLSGVYRVSKSLIPANGAILSGGTLQWTGQPNTGSTYAIKCSGASFTDTGTTFIGAGLNLDGSTGATLTGNTIENIPGGTPFGLYFGSLTNATIDKNTFTNIAAVGAIMGYDPQGCHFDGNTITSCYEGMHILWNNASGNCTVSNNDVSGFTRHGIELQGDPQGLTVSANYVHDPAAAASHIWLSIATGGEMTRSDSATGVAIKGNVLTAPPGFNANPSINYCAIEAMGLGTQVVNNYVAGMGWCGLFADNAMAGQSTSMTWSNNQFHAVGAGYPCTGEGSASYLASMTPIEQGNTQDGIWSGVVPPAILATVGPAAMGPGPITQPVSVPATQPASTQPYVTHQEQIRSDGKISIDGGAFQ